MSTPVRQPRGGGLPSWFTWTRAILFAVGGLMLLGGIGLVGGGAATAGDALWAIVLGGGLLIVLALERTRYRSEAAESRRDDAGPGGGERDVLEARFRPTEEVFRDPTTGRTMRVYIDPRTGERRYFAEG